MGAEAIARYIKVMVDTTGSDKAQILHRMAFVKASFLNVLVLGGDERCDGQQVWGRFSRTKHNVADATDKRFNDVFHTVQLFFGTESWKMGV